MTACKKTEKGERHPPHPFGPELCQRCGSPANERVWHPDPRIPGFAQDDMWHVFIHAHPPRYESCLGFPTYEELVAENERLRHETLTPEHVSDLLKAQYQPIKERAECAEARVKELEDYFRRTHQMVPHHYSGGGERDEECPCGEVKENPCHIPKESP